MKTTNETRETTRNDINRVTIYIATNVSSLV